MQGHLQGPRSLLSLMATSISVFLVDLTSLTWRGRLELWNEALRATTALTWSFPGSRSALMRTDGLLRGVGVY